MLISLLFSSLILFGILAITFSFLWEHNRKKLFETEKELGRQLYELNILRDLNDKIGYSLKTRDIARNIALTSEKFFPLKTASYAVVEDAKIIFESFSKGNVHDKYYQEVKKIVLNSIFTLDESLTHMEIAEMPIQIIKENELLVNSNIPLDAAPKSYFNVPLVLNNKLVGIISITSPKEKVYQDKDMSLLYKIVNQAQLAIGRLENVIETEKGKIQSLIYSLSSGALLFMRHDNELRLVTLNNAARNFLRLDGPLDAQIVLSQFKFEGNIFQEVKNVIEKKEMKLFRGVELYGKRFNLYITPVFDNATLNVIGVAVTLQDVSQEYESQKLRESFTNMIVHELRAPLSSIKVSAELLGSEKVEREEKDKLFRSIIASSERMLNDVNQLLDAARIQAGNFQTDVSPNNVIDIIEERVKTFKILAEKRHITIDFEKVGQVPVFSFDAVRMGQIMNNLLSNAIKYNHEGGYIKVEANSDGKFFHLSVSDNGPGIPKSLQPQLFDQFYQVRAEHRGTGTGLGLYITKAIVEAHGGRIWVESDEGRGTKIAIEIPMVGIQKEEKKNMPEDKLDKLYLN